MTIEARLTCPVEILEPRFMNRDGATFLQERFEQTTIARLYDWFVHRCGGDCGRRFLREAPLIDGWLAAIESSTLMEESSEGYAIGAINFVAGLAVGVELVDRVSGSVQLPTSPDLDDAIDVLRKAMVRADVLTAAPPHVAVERFCSIFDAIQQEAPGINLVMSTAFRVVAGIGDWCNSRTKIVTGAQFFFFLGLVGAGLHVPELRGEVPPKSRGIHEGRQP